MKKIKVIDSHTAGEPTRLVIDGFPNLDNIISNNTVQNTMEQRCQMLKNQFDTWRKRVILEPRGNDILVGALLCPPVTQNATAGIIFFNNKGYLGMCGHGMIGVVASLAYLGIIKQGTHRIDTPVGTISAELHQDGSVSIENVPAYRFRKQVSVDVPNYGTVVGDIAWGGNWFFLVNQHNFELSITQVKTLTEFTLAIQSALNSQKITGKDGAEIDHIELFSHSDNADSKNFVLCPGGQYDRSPCGTGTSAKVACLAEDGILAENTVWKQNSILDTQFTCHYKRSVNQHIIPIITGNAYICGENTLIIDDNDPLKNGIDS